jgi:membrane protease YdiL (CAAX protease family)
MNYLKAVGLSILLFVAVYAPIFLLISRLHVSANLIVPIVIVLSFFISIIYILLINKRLNFNFSDFGFNKPTSKLLIEAILIALPPALLLTWALQFVHEKNPFGDISFKTWELLLYFGLGAAIQEEIIFRGLLQFVMIKQSKNIVFSVIGIAILFALIHLEVGIFTALSALILGLIAGFYQHKSKSIWTSVCIHAVFNLCSIFWMI